MNLGAVRKMMDWDKVFFDDSGGIPWSDDMRKAAAEMYNRGVSQTAIGIALTAKIGREVTRSSVASALRRLRATGVVGRREKKIRTKRTITPTSNLTNREVRTRRPPHPIKTVREPSRVRSYEENAAMAKEARKNYTRHGESFDPEKECSIAELRSDTCHWPLGSIDDRPPYRFCGCRVLRPSPYCAGHLRASVDISKGGYKREYEGDTE